MKTPSLLAFTWVFLVLVQAAPLPVCGDSASVGSAPHRLSATGAGNSYSPVFSTDGRHIAFVSHANNLVTNDDLAPYLDLFLRDLTASNTVLVSVGTNGFGGANDNISLYTLSSNAQVIAFNTAANNLAPGDTNRVSDIYVRDLLSSTTRLVSGNADGSGSGNGPSSNPLLSEDGRYVIFESLASNLVTNDFNGTNDIFIHDLNTGVTTLVSMNAEGTASPDGPSHSPSISADGLTVAFVSHATNLVEGVTNTLGEVYARKVAEGTTRWAVASHIPWATRQNYYLSTPWRVPIPGPAQQPLVPYIASGPVLSADGRYVAFKTLKSTVRFDLHSETNEITRAFPTENVNETNYFTFLVNPRVAVDSCETPLAFTKDARFLIVNNTNRNAIMQAGIGYADFDTLITNDYHFYWPSYPNWRYQGYETNVSPLLSLVLSNSNVGETYARWTRMPWLHVNPDASRILFVADATNLVDGITNRTFHLYSLTLSNRTVSLISTNPAGKPLSSLDGIPVTASPDGSLIAWDSPDDNIVPDDLNRAWDVFVRNVDSGGTRLVSARHPDLPAASGIALSRLDLNPGAISANGQRLAVLSLDNSLVSNDTNNWRDLVVRDLVNGTNIDVSRSIIPFNPFGGPTNFPGSNAAAAPFLSADGRYVTFLGETIFSLQYTNRTIYWRDLQTSSNRLIVSGDSLSQPTLSADGRFLAFHSAASLVPGFPDGNNAPDVFVRVRLRPPGDIGPCPGSADLNYLGSGIVSRNPSGTGVGNGSSINPAFTPDSLQIVFASTANNLTGDAVGNPSMFQLYRRSLSVTNGLYYNCPYLPEVLAYGPTKLVSYTTSASADPGGRSTDLPLSGGGANPRFSADSRYVAFESSPDLIYRHDLLHEFVTTITEVGGVHYTNVARVTNDLVCSACRNPTLSADGRFVAYQTIPIPGSTRDVSVRDLQTGREELISVNLTGNGRGNGWSFTPLISHDARFVVFASRASDLVPSDNNRATDIFVRDRLNGVTHCLSRNFAGTGTGNRASSNPVMSADGRTVAFQSFASDLVPGDYNDTRDVFVVTLAGPDTDGDGMDDDWEMAYFSTLSRDGAGDFDNDGASDLDEFRAGTTPSNDTSILRVLRLTTAFVPESSQSFRSRKTVILWSAVPGRTYRLESRLSLNTPWQAVGTEIIANGVSASATHTVDMTYTSDYPYRFYRVVLVR